MLAATPDNPFTPKRALVTGGAGFIGSHLCRALLARGAEVVVVDDLSTGRAERLPQGAMFVNGDVRDVELLSRALAGVDAVFHLAARVSVRASLERFRDDASANIMGTLSVLDACRGSGVGRLVYASSMAVYADQARGRLTAEDHVTAPIAPYGISKLAGELYCRTIAPTIGIEPVVVRYFNTYGRGQTFTPYVGVITIFINKLLAGEVPTIFGDGEQTRDFVSVADIVEGTLLAMERGPAGDTFNLGTGRPCTVNRLAALVAAHFGRDAGFARVDAHEGELACSVADISHARNVLGYAPSCRLEDDLDALVRDISAGLSR